MNKLKLFPIALTALVLGACSSEDIIDNGGQGPVAQGEKGYVSFAINLPTTPSTRANDVFDDGAAYEYNVNDATLLIFNGDSEDDAKFSGAYNLTLGNAEHEGGVNDNITTTHKAIASFVKPSGNVYALVIVNKGDVLTGSEEDGWKLNDANLTSGTTSFNDFRTVAQSLTVNQLASTADDGYFFMTNAPLYTVQGGTQKPTDGKAVTLTEIPSASIYPTQSEAESKPATSIYVERAVAKVTVTADNGKESGTVGTGTIPYTLSGWTLDITNKQSYIVRNVKDASWWGYKADGSDDYRFVGSANVSNDDLYRTYWAYDPNYDTYNSSAFNMLQGTTPTSLTKVGGNAYCLENTFNVANQNQNQTTRVIVAATLKGGEDFCILNNDKTTLYKKEDVIKAIKEEYLKNSTVVAALKNPDTGLKDGSENVIGEGDLTVTFSHGGTEMTEQQFLNGGTNALGGDLTVAEIQIKDGSASKFKEENIPTVLTPGGDGNADIIAAVNNGKKVSYYKGGVAYYPVMIRHFDEDQTPWTAEGKTVSYPEPNAEANWLGRYGVLRNNWYEINVTGIKSIGSADVPDVDGTPDDPLESWISVEINVLSWAMRSQNVEL